ncbi:odorant receptor 94a-like [Hyposmocoma kahamanoa]|uniref:odorant receptor 94a-like n=1 Tax=Hyposmocoma kahamanoa TaxID=1477025 RepID=UPI000E6D5EF5|nr:odorant receptor 94a-like [Hyposmocoma kahamanoa]
MGFLNYVWRKLTPTKRLEMTSGKFELVFFDSIYRAMYLTGLSQCDRGFYLIYRYAIKCMIFIFVLSEVWFFAVAKNSKDRIDNINVTLQHLFTYYRYWTMMKNIDIYKKLAKAMESQYFDTSTPGRQLILQYWINNNDRYFKILITLGTFCLAVWYPCQLFDDVEYNLVAGLKIPFNYQTPSRYAATYLVAVIFFHYTSYFTMVNDSIMQVHLMQMLCQYDVLADCFENILVDCRLNKNNFHTNEAFIQKYIKRLGDLVKQHNMILSNTSELRKILSVPMLVQLGGNAMVICFSAYRVTMAVGVEFLKSLLHLAYSMIMLFILCKWCDEIKVQVSGLRIGDAVYFSGWEEMAKVPGVRARLMMVAARSNWPLALTAGGIYDLSLRSYTTLIKTSYSCLTLLLQSQKD